MLAPDNVIAVPLTDNQYKQIICDVVNSGLIYLTKHAKQRLKQRKIDLSQVKTCLKHGHFVERPSRQPNGAIKATMRGFASGDHVNVAFELDSDSSGNFVLVITAYLG